MKRRRLVFIIDSAFPYQSGGRETWLAEMINRLNGDFCISVVSMMNYTTRRDPFHFIPPDVKVHSVPSLFNIRKGGRFSTLKHLFGGFLLFSFIASILVFLKYSFPNTLTYIISMNPGHAFLPAIFVRGRNLMRIASVRGAYMKEMERLFPKFGGSARVLQSLCYRKTDLILANGEDTRDVICSEMSDHTRVRILKNGVDYNRFSKAFKQAKTDLRVIGMISTLSPERGTDAILHAAKVLKRNPEIQFRVLLVGKGNVEQYRKKADELDVGDVVSFLGERTDVDRVLSDMDITLAITDGLGISHSLLEEMAAGKAVVAWSNPTYKQIVEDGVDGLLVSDRKPETLAKAIETLVMNDALAYDLGRAAQAKAELHDWQVVEEGFRSILQQLSTSSNRQG